MGFEQRFDLRPHSREQGVELIFPKITEPQMHDPWWRRLRDDLVGKIRVFADDDQFASAGKFPNLRVAGIFADIGNWNDWVKNAIALADFRRRENPSCHLHHGEMVAHHARGVIKACLHVSACEARIFFEHVFDGIAGGEKFQNRLHRNACPANNRPPIANIRVD